MNSSSLPQPMSEPDSEGTPESDRIVMGLIYLLVQLATRGTCATRVLAIGQHLEMLSSRRDISPALRATTLQLRDHWLRCCAQPPGRPATHPQAGVH